MATHETNDSMDRGHDTPDTSAPKTGTKDRSTWSKRLEMFDNPPPGVSTTNREDSPQGSSTPTGSSEAWEDISSRHGNVQPAFPGPGTQATDLPAPSSDSPSQWPDPNGIDVGLAAARRESSDRRAEIAGLRGALGAAHHQLQNREGEIAELSTRLSVANATTQARQDELNALGARHLGSEEKRAAVEQELGRLRDKLQRSDDVAQKRESQIENLRTTRTTLEETLKARDRVIHARDEELAAREQELQAMRLRISTLQKSIADRDADLAMLADQLLTQQERSRALEAEIGGREQVVSNQREKLVERDDQLASLLATLDVVERTLARRPVVAEFGEHDGGTDVAVVVPSEPTEAEETEALFTDVERETPTVTDSGHEAIATADDVDSVNDDEAADHALDASEASNADPSDEENDDTDQAVEESETEQDLDASSDAEGCDHVEDQDPENQTAEPAETDEVDACVAEDNLEHEDPLQSGEAQSVEAEALPETADTETENDVADAASDGEAEAPIDTAPDEATDRGVEPGSATPSQGFDTELANLTPAGDLYRQRPPAQSPIYRWWRDQQLEKVEALPAASFDELIVNAISQQCAERGDDTVSVLSLCGSDPELEIRIGQTLMDQGHENFVIDCIDDRASWHDARAGVGANSGMSDKINSLPGTYESFSAEPKYDVFIADAALQHVADLDALFDRVKTASKEESVLVISASLGASAAGPSPEHVETVNRIWSVMSDRYMVNHVSGETQTQFIANEAPSDAPGSGGALAPNETPLLPKLLDGYGFEVFVAFGNLINAYVGPEVGPNFDPGQEADRNFIERFSELDEAQISAGTIHPVHIVAQLRSGSAGDTVMIENRAPERCLELTTEG